MTDTAKATEDEDYVFRYRLREEGEAIGAPFYEDHVLEMVRQQLENLLNVIIPTHRGKEVKVDGFKLLSDLETVHGIFPLNDRRRQEE